MEELDSEYLFSMSVDSMEKLSFKTVESEYFQICNTIKRYHGCWNKYYNIGVYTYKKNKFEILQYTNGYSVFTYLVTKRENKYPKMLLIDMRTGDVVDVSFKIKKGLIYLSYVEHCGEFPITVHEIYYLDNKFSVIQSYEINLIEDVDIIPE